MEPFWDPFGIILGSFWYHFGIILESFWDNFGVILGSLWNHYSIILESFWDDFEIILGPFWNQFGIIIFEFFHGGNQVLIIGGTRPGGLGNRPHRDTQFPSIPVPGTHAKMVQTPSLERRDLAELQTVQWHY